MPRFFRRFGESVFDLNDLRKQMEAQARFIRQAAQKYEFDREHVIAVGFSNGPNIAASLLFSEPGLLSGATLFRPMVPFVADPRPDLRRASTLLAAGRRDPIVSREQTSALANILEGAGARVSMHWHEGGHQLAQDDLVAAQQWMQQWRLPT